MVYLCAKEHVGIGVDNTVCLINHHQNQHRVFLWKKKKLG